MTDFLLKNIVSAENLVNFTATDTAIVKNGIVMSGTDSGTGDVHNITIVAPNDASFTASYTLTMPVNDGNAGQVLTTDGSGVLSWGTDATGLFSEDSNGGGITDHNIYGGTGAGGSLASGAVENFLAGVNAGNALTTGDSNICIGNTALLVGTDAIQNVAIGVGSLSSAVSINGANTNSRNVAIGHDSLLNVNGSAFSEGGYNVAIGDSTGATATTANSCILIGASANVSGATVGNEIVIGYGATGKGANTALIGNDDTTDVYIGQSSTGTSPPNLVLVGDDGGTDYTIKIRAPSSGSFTANSELILPADVPVAGEVLKVTSVGSGIATLEWGAGGGTYTAASSIIFNPEIFLFTQRAYDISLPYLFQANTVTSNAQHGKCYFYVAETLSTYYLKVTMARQNNAGILRLDIQDAGSSTTIGGSFPYDFDTYSASSAFPNGLRTLTVAGISLTAGTKYQLVLSTNGKNAASTDYNLYMYNNGLTLGENLNGFTTGIV